MDSSCKSMQGPTEVRLLPMRTWKHLSGNAMLDAYHKAQHAQPIRAVWDPAFRLPVKLVEYVCAVTADFEPQIRQEALLLLKRYVWVQHDKGSGKFNAQGPNLQVVALVCAHLSMKHWQQRGIPEQKLHMLSRNYYTRQDFIDAEVAVLQKLGCSVYWEGVLLAEWQAMLLFFARPLLAEESDALAISGVAAHITDVLAFQDELMATYLPSELAAASLHASAIMCTKHFARYTFTLRVGHLCRIPEEKVVQLSEEILTIAIGHRCAEFLLEGGGITAEESDLDSDYQDSDSRLQRSPSHDSASRVVRKQHRRQNGALSRSRSR